jgi:endonuclease/exonuclease/phosphatase family metal-dependent hydrolase
MSHQQRLMTYNVHGGVGTDRRLDLGRIADVIAAADPDIVALQELDVGRDRSHRLDQPAWLAERLGMHFEFASARECGGGRYGNAVLSRHPLRSVRSGCLPQLDPSTELRAVQLVRIEAPMGRIDVLNTHLGLRSGERAIQTEALLEWLGDTAEDALPVLCGDLNASPSSPAYRRLTRVLQDAQTLALGRRAQRTWPSLWPVLRIDHVLVGAGVAVAGSRVPGGNKVRLASDHLPLVVDLAMEPAQ